MTKLYLTTILLTALLAGCTRCYYCIENGAGVNGFKVCTEYPDYEAAKDAAKSGQGYVDTDSLIYKCE
ncbi:MAG TPA: hypothetical protein VK154_10470 [Chitinophagales bacterium]|nr:hypothetical protein [Chitinophagales bacterium]